MNNLQTKITSPLASLKRNNSDLSPLISQVMFGETVEIFDKSKNWSFCRCHGKSYEGWIENDNIGLLPKSTHYISNIISLVFEKPDIKSNLICNLYLNSKITVLKENNDWVEIILSKNQKGYVPNKHVSLLNIHHKNWIDVAKEFINSPYLWGGKTCIGIDCSGLVQTSLETSGITIPRDSIDQLSYSSDKIKNVETIKRGCLIFWKGHVAIATSSSKILHSNSFHMSVMEENLDIMHQRMQSKKYKILGIKYVLA